MEFTKVNENYGHSYIIKNYINLSQLLPLPFIIQHGWASAIETPNYYINMGIKGIWVWNENSKKAMIKTINHKSNIYRNDIFVGGAPFIYLYENNIKKVKRRKGTIVFPAHSAVTVKVITDFEKFAEMLENLPKEFKPITVCMYYRDIELNNHLPFKKRGFKIVSNGNSYNKNFLIRFVKHTVNKRYAISNKVGTSLLYSAYLGVRSYLYGPGFTYYNISDNYLPKGKIKKMLIDSYIDRLKPYFRMGSSHKEQNEISQIELGKPFLKRQSEIYAFIKTLMNYEYFTKLYSSMKEKMDLIKIEGVLDKIKEFKKIIIAGAGSHTKMLLKEFPALKDNIIVILDRDKVGGIEDIRVAKEKDIEKYDFDIILISSKSFEINIYKRLLKLKVPEDKIIGIYYVNK